MINIRTLSILLFAAILFIRCAPKEKTWELSSPDKKLTIKLIWQRKDTISPELSYSVVSEQGNNSQDAIQRSPLGITRKDVDFSKGLMPEKENKILEIDESYSMLTGKKSHIRNHCNELTVPFKTRKGKKLEITLRAYDDGVAFRYRFPETDSTVFTVTGESTGFRIPTPGKCWIQPYDAVTEWSPAYETYYKNGIETGSKSPGHEGWAFPALFESNGIWILLTESNLDAHFYGAHLQPDADNGFYKIRLPEKEEAREKCSKYPSSALPWKTPWRLIIIGNTPATIVESNLVYNLADPSKVDEKSWIKPGKAAWSWWSDPPSPQDFKKQVPFADLSKEMSWDYILVDANWDRMKNGKIEDLIKYAGKMGIGVWLWYNSGGPYNTVTEAPRNLMFNRKERQAEFRRISELGVKGVKIDFFQSDKPEVIRQYLEILEDAAVYKIMCNFHGCTIPRGWARTYPHNLSSEAVRGAECYIFDKSYPESAPWHNAILPFTRNVIGSMDYTPVTFTDEKYKHLTSYGYEIALSVVFESGIEHFADRVNAYLKLPEFAKKFLSEVPNTWDETRFLDGYPGQFIVLARQKNGVLYLGGINGQNEEKQIRISLPFVDVGSYLLEIITDGAKDRSFMYFKKPFNNKSEISLTLKPRGGFVAKLIKPE